MGSQLFRRDGGPAPAEAVTISHLRRRDRRRPIAGRGPPIVWPSAAIDRLPQIVLAGVVCVFAGAACIPRGWAAERVRPAMPLVLTLRQLDSITAAGTSVRVVALATAHGPTAITSTQGSVQSGQVTILRIDYDPQRPPLARARFLAIVPGQLYFAHGRASASGATDAQASVNIVLSGNFAYVHQVSETTITPTSMTQAAAAFAIALPGN